MANVETTARPGSVAAGAKTATLYRMVMDKHLCPYGLKAKFLLEREGYAVDDHHLTTRDAVDAFKAEHGVKTTPQTWIGGRRIGGYDDLRAFFGKDGGKDGLTYIPVIAIFAMALAMALAVGWATGGALAGVATLERFIAIAMCLLALQKLQDVETFSTMFLNYDLLARRFVPYSYFYPFAEGAAGVLMLAGALIWLAAPLAIFIGSIGAASVFKAVYIDKREIKCACVGGNSKVPLGFVSLTENVMMLAMGVWMLI